MKKLIPLILITTLFSACKNVAELSEQDNPAGATPTPVAAVVSQELSNHALNGALATAANIESSSIIAKVESLFGGSLLNGEAAREVHTVTEDDKIEFQNEAKEVIATLFQNQIPLPMADGWVQTSPSVDFCSKINLSDEDYSACAELIQHFTFRVNLTSPHSGKIIGYIDQNELLKIEFVENGMLVEVKISTIPLLFSAVKTVWLQHGVVVDLPTLSSASGTIMAVVTKSNPMIHLSLSITEDVDLTGTANDTPISLHINEDSEVNLEVDQDNQLTTVSFDVKNIDLHADFSASIKNGVSGKIIFDNQNHEVRTEKLSLDYLNVTDVTEPIHLFIHPLTSTLRFQNSGFTLSHLSDFAFYLNLVDGSTSWHATPGSITVYGVDEPWKREGSTLEMSNGGVFGKGDLTVPEGSCFNLKPWQVVDCNP